MINIRKIQEQVLYDAVKAASDDETAAEIVFGEVGQALSGDDAAWVKSAMRRLDSCFDRTAVKQIRMACQCGYGMDEKLALLRELMASSSSLEELASQDKARAAGLFCKDGDLYLRFPFCPCPMLADVSKLDSDAWCQCTTGYSQALFEKAFGCEVNVELLQSIKMGDEICLQKIIPHEVIWNRQTGSN